jgi:hypothetical protein
MKKIMSLMLGLMLVMGTTALFAADEKPADQPAAGKKKAKKAKKADEAKKEAPAK